MGETSKELLKKIPAEKCWELTARILTGYLVMRGTKKLPTVLGTEKGFFSPVRGWEKHKEVTPWTYGEVARKFFPWLKETFSISVEDATGAATLYIVATTLLQGPEFTPEIVEATPERAVWRITNCAWWERYKEFEVEPELVVCDPSHQAWGEEGLMAVNPKIDYKIRKTMPVPRGDPYCEAVIEFKED